MKMKLGGKEDTKSIFLTLLTVAWCSGEYYSCYKSMTKYISILNVRTSFFKRIKDTVAKHWFCLFTFFM